MAFQRKPFAQEIYSAIKTAAKLRILLIARGYSLQQIKKYQCEKMEQGVDLLFGEKQLAEYLCANYYKILDMIPGSHPVSKRKLTELCRKAELFLKEHKAS